MPGFRGPRGPPSAVRCPQGPAEATQGTSGHQLHPPAADGASHAPAPAPRCSHRCRSVQIARLVPAATRARLMQIDCRGNCGSRRPPQRRGPAERGRSRRASLPLAQVYWSDQDLSTMRLQCSLACTAKVSARAAVGWRARDTATAASHTGTLTAAREHSAWQTNSECNRMDADRGQQGWVGGARDAIVAWCLCSPAGLGRAVQGAMDIATEPS